MSRLHKNTVISLPYKYIFIITILLIFGLYKNGFLLINYGFNDYKILLKFFSCIFMGASLGIIYDKITKQNNYINTSIFLLLLLIIMPISINPIIYFFICLVYLTIFFFTKKLNFNIIALVKVITIIVLNAVSSYNYLNLLEQSGQFNYNFIDKMIGYNPSAIFTSSFILVFLSIGVLFFDKYYKKEIFIWGIASYLASLLFVALLQKDMLIFVTNALNSLVWFGLGVIASIPNFSPLKKKIQIVYGVILGIMTVVFSLYFNFYDGVFIAVVLGDILNLILTFWINFYVKKKEKSHFLVKQKEEIG